MIDDIDPKVLAVTQQKSTMKKIVRNFLHANALFSDPSFCPIEEIYKYFNLLQISVQYLVQENEDLKRIVKAQKNESKATEDKLKATMKKASEAEKIAKTQPQTIFQCPFCPKAYYSPTYVHKHVNRDHQEDLKKYAQSQPVVKKEKTKKSTVALQPKTNQDLEVIRDEIKAMFERFDTTIKVDQERQMTELKKRLREIENKITENGFYNNTNDEVSSSSSSSSTFSGEIDEATALKSTLAVNEQTFTIEEEDQDDEEEEDI